MNAGNDIQSKCQSVSSFRVTEKRKKIWQIELEMLSVFINICNKNNLRYYAIGGTLLGAIRHNGFIPWDDDIDIAMPRYDYDIFLRIAQETLDNKYFLQWYGTEKLYPCGHAQIRNSETTCFTKSSYTDLKNGKNCGIFIDIFPYDFVGEKPNRITKRIRKIKAYLYIKIYNIKPRTLKEYVRKIFIDLLFYNNKIIEKYVKKMNVLSSECGKKDFVGLVSFTPDDSRNIWKTEWFAEKESHIFENILIDIPKNYDDILKKEYGNYMEYPKNVSGNLHGGCYFDCNLSYKAYKNISKLEFDSLFLDY